MEYNLEPLFKAQDNYIDTVRYNLVTLDQHIVTLWRNALIKPKLTVEHKARFKQFFDHTAFIIDETLYLESYPHFIDDQALDNLKADFLDLMSKARDIVADVRVILEQI